MNEFLNRKITAKFRYAGDDDKLHAVDYNNVKEKAAPDKILSVTEALATLVDGELTSTTTSVVNMVTAAK